MILHMRAGFYAVPLVFFAQSSQHASVRIPTLHIIQNCNRFSKMDKYIKIPSHKDTP